MAIMLIPSAAALAGAAAVGVYATVSPVSQIFGRTLTAPSDPDQLALTFDDGPNPAFTPKLLEVLARHNARATFFVIGQYVLREPGLAREILAAGHTIGNHTMHHPWLPRHGSAFIRAELADGNKAIEDTLGVPVKLFRPPHGARRPAVLRIARSLGLETVEWNLIVGDWNPHSAAELLGRVTRGIARNQRKGRGTNLVLHDGSQHTPAADRSATVEAVGQLLAGLSAGTRLVTPLDWL